MLSLLPARSAGCQQKLAPHCDDTPRFQMRSAFGASIGYGVLLNGWPGGLMLSTSRSSPAKYKLQDFCEQKGTSSANHCWTQVGSGAFTGLASGQSVSGSPLITCTAWLSDVWRSLPCSLFDSTDTSFSLTCAPYFSSSLPTTGNLKHCIHL